MSVGIKLTVEDLETGESESKVIWDDYLLICAGNRYLSSVQASPTTGTATLIVKRHGGEQSNG